MKNTSEKLPHIPYSAYEILLLLLLVILGFALRYHGIERQGLWTDELFGITTAYMPHYKDIIPRMIADSHPPGYLSFLYFYVPFFDGSEFLLRLHSLIAGTLLIFLTHMFGRRYFSVPTGLIAALLVAVNYESIYYSQEARAYAMLSLFCLGSFYFLLGFLLDGACSNAKKAAFVLSSTTAMYLHYNGVVFVGCEGILFFIALCVRKWNFRFLHQGALMFGVCGLLYLPWAKTMYHHMHEFSDYWGAHQVVNTDNLLELMDFLLGPYWEYSKALLCGSWLICLVTGLQLFLPKKLQRATSTTLISILATSAIAIMPIAVFYIKSKISMPVFQDRHFVVLTPFLMLTIAIPLAFFVGKLSSTTLRYGLLLLLLCALGWKQIDSNIDEGIYRIFFKDAIREAFETIKYDHEFMGNTNKLVFISHWQMGYYLKKMGLPIDSVAYTDGHYEELKNELIHAGEFYFVSITPAENFPFIPASEKDFNMVCRREMLTRSGVVGLVKMQVKDNSPQQATTECAPEYRPLFNLR